MYNAVLHLLTNRITGFSSPVFPSASSYEVHVEGDGEAYLRTFLKLRQGDPEYYLISLIAAVKSFTEIEEEFKEEACTFNLGDFRRQEFSVKNASLVSSSGKIAAVVYKPEDYPIPPTTVVKYYDSSEVTIMRGKSTARAPYSMRTGNLMDIAWPANLGISGLLDLGGNTWGAGIPITITHVPDIFPYDAMSAAAIKNNKVFKHMDDVGTLKMFNAAQTPIEQAALLGLTVATPWKYVA